MSDRVLRLVLLMCPAWVAVVLAMPGNAFETGRVYDAMQQLASEEVWAFGTAAVVFFGVFGVVSGNSVLCRLGAGVAVLWYGVMGVCYIMGNPASTGASAFLTLAAISAFLTLRNRPALG